MMEKLPKGWVITNVGSISKVKGGKRLPKGHTYSLEPTNFPYIRVTDFANQTISSEKLKYLNEDTQSAIKNYTISNKDIYISIAGTIGVTGIIPEKLTGANLTENAAKITDLKDCNNKYVSLFLSSIDGQLQIKENTKTTTQPKLSLYRIEQINIPIPPLKTQELIVSKIEQLFSELDKGVEDLKKAQQQLKTYRQSVLKWAFEGRLTNENVEDGVLPKGWVLTDMSSVIEKPKYGTSKKCDYGIDGIGVLRIPNISNGVVDSSDIKFAKFDAKEFDTYSLKEGDILTIRSNGSVDLVGKCALISKRDEKYLYAGYLIRLRPIKINPKYLINILSSIDLRNQIEGKAKSTSGVNNINSDELSTLKIQIPPSLEEQKRIVEEIESRLSVADKLEENIKENLQQAEALRQSILKKAFSGELVES